MSTMIQFIFVSYFMTRPLFLKNVWNPYSGTSTDVFGYDGTWCHRMRYGEYRCLLDACVDIRTTFATAAKLLGWRGLNPRNDVSNGRYKSRRISYSNKYLRQIMIECAWSASRTKNCFFSNFSYVQVTQRHKNKMKIHVAIARKMPWPYGICSQNGELH